MAQITKTVDKTIVNGSEAFIYTLNISYSGLIQPAQSGILTDFFPSKILFTLPQIGGQIKDIIQTSVPGGTLVTFDFGAVNAGTSLSFTIACSFGPGRVNNDSFINIGLLFADGVQVAISTAPVVHLILTSKFQLSKALLNPTTVHPGQTVTFVINLRNLGDLGSEITNIVISDILPAKLTPVTSFLPIGIDIPLNGYSDSTYNGLTGTWSGSNLQFTLPSYKGANYQIKFDATVATDVMPEEIITNIATWTTNGSEGNNAIYKLVVFSESDQFNFYKQGPRSGLIGTPLNYTLSNSNNGTTILSNYMIDDTIPSEIDIRQLKFTSSLLGIPSYSIFIATSDNPAILKPVVQNVLGDTTLKDLTSLIPVGTRVTEVKLTAPALNIVNSGHVLTLIGNINNTAITGERIINTAIASAIGIQATSSWATDITGSSDLNVVKSIFPLQAAYFPLEDFQFILLATPLNTITVDPILADLLPDGILYVADSEYFQYTNSITGVTYDSRLPGFPIPLPTREIINDFEGTGQTLIRWSFNFIQPQNDTLRLLFTCFVEINPPSSFINNGYEGNPGDNIAFVYGAIPDTLDYDGDGIIDEQISASQTSGIILTTSEFLIKKQVKGATDLAFSSAGTTMAGGNISYKLTITNNQSSQIKNINIVDILPYVGDTGVILTTSPRNSQFNVYATSTVSAQLINLIGNPVDPNPDIMILYSTSKDPVRFDQFGNLIGTGTWSLVPPDDITTIASIQIITGPDVILNSYDQLIINFEAVAPVGSPIGQIAYNSFAVMADKIEDEVVEALLPTEPNKVGVRVLTAKNGSIGEFVWFDINGNGIYDQGEPGVNGVNVELYDANKNILQTTVTANNDSNQMGYYLFTNLPEGKYFVKFIPFGDYTLTQQQDGQINGSTPNPITSFTNEITLAKGQVVTRINAGLLLPSCMPPVIHASDKCLHIGDIFNPLNKVTATDCAGNDITSKIIVVQNTVNTAISGVYTVTYSVKDSYNQTTIKKITVIVCQTSPRQQAISDLVESVALEQAALSHILNAEGAKIQAMLNVESATIDEILAVNNSVLLMVKSITFLELILKSKLEVLDCQLCKSDDCCKIFH